LLLLEELLLLLDETIGVGVGTTLLPLCGMAGDVN
jgi:hypothetical protein